MSFNGVSCPATSKKVISRERILSRKFLSAFLARNIYRDYTTKNNVYFHKRIKKFTNICLDKP